MAVISNVTRSWVGSVNRETSGTPAAALWQVMCHPDSSVTAQKATQSTRLFGRLEFNVPFQHKSETKVRGGELSSYLVKEG